MAARFSKDTCCLWYPVDLYKTSKKPLVVLHHKALRGSYRVTATECVLNFRPAHLPGPITHKISPGNNSPDTGFELVQKKNGGWKFIANREIDRKSTRLNSSHGYISYAVFCLKKKNRTQYC